MKKNLNFENEYDLTVSTEDKIPVLTLIKKITDNKPGLVQEAKLKIKEDVKGGVYVYFGNTSAFDDATLRIIKNFLNQYKYKKPSIKEMEDNAIKRKPKKEES
jgi:hypothetical protein